MDRVRGIIALPIAAWGMLVAAIVRGPLRLPGHDGWAAQSTSTAFAAWSWTAIGGSVLLAAGLFVWQGTASMPSRLRRLGTACLVAGSVAWLPILGAMAFAWPAVGATTAMHMVMEPVFLAGAGLAAALSSAGLILLGAWQGRVDRVAAAALVVATLRHVPVHAAELLGSAALAVAATRMAWRAHRHSEPSATGAGM